MSLRLENERRIVDRYRLMADASRRMLSAARSDDWDAVCVIEKECAAIIAELSTMGDLSPDDLALRDQKLEFMRRVLADDAQIRLLSQPWLKKLDTMMRSPATSERLNRAYGAGTVSG